MTVRIVCSACLTEACAQGTALCPEARKTSFPFTHAVHEDDCPICSTSTATIRSILEAVCRRDGISLESGIEPGQPARNFELAERLGIPGAFQAAADDVRRHRS